MIQLLDITIPMVPLEYYNKSRIKAFCSRKMLKSKRKEKDQELVWGQAIVALPWIEIQSQAEGKIYVTGQLKKAAKKKDNLPEDIDEIAHPSQNQRNNFVQLGKRGKETKYTSSWRRLWNHSVAGPTLFQWSKWSNKDEVQPQCSIDTMPWLTPKEAENCQWMLQGFGIPQDQYANYVKWSPFTNHIELLRSMFIYVINQIWTWTICPCFYPDYVC